MKRIVALTLALCLLLHGGGKADAACSLTGTTLGLNWFIVGSETSFFGKNYIANKTAREAEMKRELAMLASLGVKYVRVILLPAETGFVPSTVICSPSSTCNGATLDNAVMDQTATNLTGVTISGNSNPGTGLIPLAASYGIKVVVSFSPSHFVWGGSGHPPWYDAYGNNDTSWALFTGNTVTWEDRIVDAIEATSAKNNVLYYDLVNEQHYSNPKKNAVDPNNTTLRSNFMRAILNGVSAPDTRRGVALLIPCESNLLKADSDAMTKPLSHFDAGHAYPFGYYDTYYPGTCGVTSAQTYGSLLATAQPTTRFPDACLIAGEFAVNQCDRAATGGFPVAHPSRSYTQDDQATWMMTLYNGADSATSAGAKIAFHWGFFDKWWGSGAPPEYGDFCTADTSGGFGWAWGWDLNYPKHVYGKVTDLPGQNILPGGGDFESANLFKERWSATANGTRARMGSDASAAATGYYYARMTNTVAGALCSPWAAVSSKGFAAVSAYLRGEVSGTNVTVKLNYATSLGGTGSLTQVVTGISVNDFKQIQALVTNGFKFTLPANTNAIQVCFEALPPAGGTTCGATKKLILDVDAVSLNAFNAL